MSVVVQRNVVAGTLVYDVWFRLEDAIHGRVKYGYFERQEFGPPRMQWMEAAPGTQVEPTLRLGAQELDMLARGVDEYGPLSEGQSAFLKDVVRTRDRLLSLVENLVQRGDGV